MCFINLKFTVYFYLSTVKLGQPIILQFTRLNKVFSGSVYDSPKDFRVRFRVMSKVETMRHQVVQNSKRREKETVRWSFRAEERRCWS